MYRTVNFYYCTALPIIHTVLKNQACNIYKYWSYNKNLRVIFLVCFLSAYFTLVDSSFESNRLYLAWPSELGAGDNCFPIYLPEYKQNSSPSKGLQLLFVSPHPPLFSAFPTALPYNSLCQKRRCSFQCEMQLYYYDLTTHLNFVYCMFLWAKCK